MTTTYHYHGEKRKRKDGDRQWKASFRRWMNAQMQTISAKLAKGERLTDAEVAINSAEYFIKKAQKHLETVNVA
jgi:hypothetical protein